jgi:hypothetical protein
MRDSKVTDGAVADENAFLAQKVGDADAPPGGVLQEERDHPFFDFGRSLLSKALGNRQAIEQSIKTEFL